MEQAILNNNINKQCYCCDQPWHSLFGNYYPEARLFSDNVLGTNTVHIEVLSEYLNAPSPDWFNFKSISLPIGFDYNNALVAEIGEVSSSLPAYTLQDGDIVRTRHVDTKGCTHYSNPIILFT